MPFNLLKIKALLKEKKITQDAFSEMINVSRPTILNYFNGRSKIDVYTIQKIAEVLGVEVSFFFSDNVDTNIVKEPKPAYKTTRKDNSIPLLPIEAVAGFGAGGWSVQEQDIQESYTVPEFHNIDFMIRVKGSSMYPKYNSGDVIACRKLNETNFIQWNKVYVVSTEEQGILVKRLEESEKENCLLAVSDNEKYKPFNIPKTEITGIALVIGVIRLE